MAKTPLILLALVTAFGAGVMTHAFLSGHHPVGEPMEAKPSKTVPVSDRSLSFHDGDTTRKHVSRENAALKNVPFLTLRPEVVDALLAGGDVTRKLTRMNLTEEQRKSVSMIRAGSVKALKDIEAAHAKVISDEKGDYVSVDAFPEERNAWLGKMESDLREMLGDDRASVIARMIVFADNDEDVGIYRRELIVTPPHEGDGKMRIEEKTFNDAGQHVDSDYELVDSSSKSRWGHLLDFGNVRKNE